jgi:UDP-glucose 4-epimerase
MSARFKYWSIEKVKHMLGYGPRYNLPRSSKLSRGERAHYPYADLPWWGV